MNLRIPLVLIAVLIASFVVDIYLFYPIANTLELGFKMSCILICIILGLLFYRQSKFTA